MLQPLAPGVVRLLQQAAYCQLATINRDGSPQLTNTWVDTDGYHVLINTAEGRLKVRNVRRDPRVAVNVIDPADFYRRVVVRGTVVEITSAGADAHIDTLAFKYLGEPTYLRRDATETRLILRIAPLRVATAKLD
jgi:PPOX class probable F420-dependent enzyme